MSTSPSPESARPGAVGSPTGGLAGTLALYTLARVGLLALVAAVLVLVGTPLVIAVLVALVVALPLSMLLFRGLRARLDATLAATRERRGAQREALRAGLRGDAGPRGDAGDSGADDVPSGDRTERQADGGGG